MCEGSRRRERNSATYASQLRAHYSFVKGLFCTALERVRHL